MIGSSLRGLGQPTHLWLLLAAACGSDSTEQSRTLTIETAEVVVSTVSEALGHPVDVAVGPTGTVYVLDRAIARIVCIDRGVVSKTMGREGEGPAEFRVPSVLAVGGDTIWVADVGNSRVQAITTDGQYLHSYPAALENGIYPAFLSSSGELLVGTGGHKDGLAARFDHSGNEIAVLGEPLTDPVTIIDLPTMKREAAERKVPGMLRNQIQPVLSDGGRAWLILTAEALVQRYDNAGDLIWSVPVVDPTLATIMDAYSERNRTNPDPMRFRPLVYVYDALLHNDRLWMLLNTPEGHPSVVLVLSAEGTVMRRLELSAVRAARAFALDEAARRLYLVIPAEASLMAVTLPPEVLPGS